MGRVLPYLVWSSSRQCSKCTYLFLMTAHVHFIISENRDGINDNDQSSICGAHQDLLSLILLMTMRLILFQDLMNAEMAYHRWNVPLLCLNSQVGVQF